MTFGAGDGVADATLTFTGQQIAINAALDGLRFNPAPGYAGTASVAIVSEIKGKPAAAAR